MPSNWVFGYGSLVWRPAFTHEEHRPAFVRGLTRRFFQGSTDHRGVPGAPGRVATLIAEANGITWGRAYRITKANQKTILAKLDHREQGGYAQHRTTIFQSDGKPLAEALLYVANRDNDNWLGPAPLEAMARQIRGARGPSGHNIEYVVELARALRDMGAEDAHVFSLADLLDPSW